MCLLQATGRKTEAAELERTDLPPAIAAARITCPVVAEATVLAEETERVASASVLAELLAPLLAERMHAAASGGPASVTLAAKPESTSAPHHAPASSPVRATPSASAAVPGIADLIDGMLSQQGAAPRSPAR